MIYEHFCRLQRCKGHDKTQCSYLKSLKAFHELEFRDKEQLLDTFYEKVMPRDSCLCKLQVSKWAACQRYQLQKKLELL